MNTEKSDFDIAVEHYNELLNIISTLSSKESFSRVKEFSISLHWKHLSFAQKFDMYVKVLDVSIPSLDSSTTVAAITLAREQLKIHSDFERSNKLNIYEGVFAISSRDFDTASKFLVDSIPTFNCDDFINLETTVLYAIISELLSHSRIDFKTSIVSSASIRQITAKIGYLDQFIDSYVKCEFNKFIDALSVLYTSFIESDFYLSPHAAFVLSNIRLVIYRQYLSAFSSVSLDTMASDFGIDTELLRADLNSFSYHGLIAIKVCSDNEIYIEPIESSNIQNKYAEVMNRGDVVMLRLRRMLPIC